MYDRAEKIKELISVSKPKEWKESKNEFITISDERLESIIYFNKHAFSMEQSIALSIHAVSMSINTSMTLEDANEAIAKTLMDFNNL